VTLHKTIKTANHFLNGHKTAWITARQSPFDRIFQ
jgi:hypothetical protein